MSPEMTSTPTADRPVRPLGRPVSPVWAALRYGLLALFGAVAIGIVAFGVRPASFGELADHLRTGRVSQVTLVGELPETSTGSSTVEVRWHDGALPRFTNVWQVRGTPEQQVSSAGVHLQMVRGSVVEHLDAHAPSPLSVTHIAERPSVTWTLVGWEVPGWVVIAALVGAAGLLFLVISGPQTLLATRWAWFWALTSVVGFAAVPVFLLWGQPRTGEPELPSTPAGRLTGGWAFLLFGVLAATLFPGPRPG